MSEQHHVVARVSIKRAERVEDHGDNGFPLAELGEKFLGIKGSRMAVV